LVTARQDEIEVHELALDQTELKEEEFLTQGSGSHFESRVAELVVLIPSVAGLSQLPPKVEQLVAKGFHNIVVGLAEIDELQEDGLEALSRSRQVVDTWAGTLRICEAKPAVADVIGALDGEEVFEIHSTRVAAVDAYRRSMNETPLDPGESQELLAASGEGEDLNNWGWGSEDTVEDGGSTVDIAELHATEGELLKLDSELRRIVMGGKRHVSLRLSFSRPLTNDDVDSLTGARDYLKREGGQLVLVSLPRDVLKSLRLLDLDREFVIVEGGSEAEAAHQQAAGHVASSGSTAAPTAPQPDPDPVSSVELDSGVALTSDEISGEGDSAALALLRAEQATARSQLRLSQVEAELRGLRSTLGSTQAERDKAHLTLNELQTSLRRNERRVAELEQGQARAERRAIEAEETKEQGKADTRRLDGELTRLRQELDQAREASQNAEAELATAQSTAVDAARVESLEREIADRDRRIAELEASLEESQSARVAQAADPAPTTQSGDGADLSARCGELEEEKARILTEAEAEIQRLSNERQTLREELESAGEMIERLGKELELS
jgi:anti-anti-sigma regulatory factor